MKTEINIPGKKADRAIQDIKAERQRQDAKWGEQNHEAPTWLMILGEEYGEACKAACNAGFDNADWAEYRKELVQVAAVTVAMIEAYDRAMEEQ